MRLPRVLNWLDVSDNRLPESQPVHISNFNWKTRWGRFNQIASEACWPRNDTPAPQAGDGGGGLWSSHQRQKNYVI